MSEPTTSAALTASEWKLIREIRSLPGGVDQVRVHEILGEFLFYIRNPRCQGVGPEGYPCGDPRSSCEQCHQIWSLLDELEARVAHI